MNNYFFRNINWPLRSNITIDKLTTTYDYFKQTTTTLKQIQLFCNSLKSPGRSGQVRPRVHEFLLLLLRTGNAITTTITYYAQVTLLITII